MSAAAPSFVLLAVTLAVTFTGPADGFFFRGLAPFWRTWQPSHRWDSQRRWDPQRRWDAQRRWDESASWDASRSEEPQTHSRYGSPRQISLNAGQPSADRRSTDVGAEQQDVGAEQQDNTTDSRSTHHTEMLAAAAAQPAVATVVPPKRPLTSVAPPKRPVVEAAAASVAPPARPVTSEAGAAAEPAVASVAPPQHPVTSVTENEAMHSHMRNTELLVKIATRFDTLGCFRRLVCECEYYSDDSDTITLEEKLILHVFGMRRRRKGENTDHEQFIEAATIGETARRREQPDPCPRLAPNCTENMVMKLRHRQARRN